MKAALFRLLQELGKEAAYFSLDRVRNHLNQQNVKLTDHVLREYVSEAMQRGTIHDAGRGWYSAIPLEAVLDQALAAPLKTLLKNQFPFLPFYVWTSQQLNPWMHHLLGKSVHFVTVESDGSDELAEFLEREGWRVLLNPTKSGTSPALDNQTAVIRGVRREIDMEAEPRIETVLIDLALENARLHLMDEAERQEMTRNLVVNNRVEISGMLTRLKNHKLLMEQFLGAADEPIISEK